MSALLRAHLGVVAVLILGLVVRVAVDRSRLPAVYQDSNIYLGLSADAPFSFSPSRPNGYPVVIRALSIVSDKLDLIVQMQHVAGLLVGLLAYVLLVRCGARRWVATLTSALIVVDAYAVGLEQDILAETFFALAVLGSTYLVVATKPRLPQLVASGALLAVATTMRVVGIFAVPFWVGYVGWLRPGLRTTAAAVLAVVLPLVAYSTFHAAHDQGFGFTAGDGWYLYGKVGAMVDCSGADIPARARPLCGGPRDQSPEFYLYNRGSPAQVLFFGPTGDVDLEKGWTPSNGRLLRSFSLGIIRAHPLEYGQLVMHDFFRYFGPNEPSVEMTLYGEPGSLMHVYERWFRMPWWLLTSSTLAATLSLFFKPPGSRSRHVTFLLGIALSLLLGTAATAGFNPRYLVPLAPLLLCAGALGIEDLVRAVARRAAAYREAGGISPA